MKPIPTEENWVFKILINVSQKTLNVKNDVEFYLEFTQHELYF